MAMPLAIAIACSLAPETGVSDGARVDVAVVYENRSGQDYAIGSRDSTPGSGWAAALVGSCEGSAVSRDPLTAPFEFRFGPVRPEAIEDPMTLGPALPVVLFDSSTYPRGAGPRHFRIEIDQGGAMTSGWVNGPVELPPNRVC
jgi:hypothetical protein